MQNVVSIQWELGGGNHEYLGLIFPDAKYQNITRHQFKTYANPGPLLQFPPNATQYEIIQS